MAASRSAGEVATWGIVASPGGAFRHGTAERPCLTPRLRQRPGLTTIRKTMITIRAARNMPPRWIFLTVARISGGGGPGGVPGGGGVDVNAMRGWAAFRWIVSA